MSNGSESLTFAGVAGKDRSRDRLLGPFYYLKGRYVRMAFRYPGLFVEGLRRPDLSWLLQRADSLEFSTPVMAEMRRQSLTKAQREFSVAGTSFPYLCHDFNHAWGTERTVEVPVVAARLSRTPASRTLEIGNVLSNYVPTQHAVVDKYERGPRIINEDVVDYVPAAPVDLVVSISTLEHVGWDEFPRSRSKFPAALRQIRSWLAPGGEAWFTVPIGYNRWLDRMIYDGTLGAARQNFLRRVSFDNRWEECALADLPGVRYGKPINHVVDRPPFPRANAVGIFVVGPTSRGT
jgi:hypothetical protein